MVEGLTIGLKVSEVKSLFFVESLVTSLALYFWTVPSGFVLILKTHLQPMGFMWG